MQGKDAIKTLAGASGEVWMAKRHKFNGGIGRVEGLLCDGRPSGLGRSVDNKISVHY